jgi:hypothetical protein
MEIRWTNCAKNEVLSGVLEQRNILHAGKQRNTNWIGDICRNCLTNTCYGRKDRRDGKTRKKTSAATGDCKEKRKYWNFKEEALYHAPWKIHFGRRLVARQTT